MLCEECWRHSMGPRWLAAHARVDQSWQCSPWHEDVPVFAPTLRARFLVRKPSSTNSHSAAVDGQLRGFARGQPSDGSLCRATSVLKGPHWAPSHGLSRLKWMIRMWPSSGALMR